MKIREINIIKQLVNKNFKPRDLFINLSMCRIEKNRIRDNIRLAISSVFLASSGIEPITQRKTNTLMNLLGILKVSTA